MKKKANENAQMELKLKKMVQEVEDKNKKALEAAKKQAEDKEAEEKAKKKREEDAEAEKADKAKKEAIEK